MTKEEYIASLNLEINDNIARLVSKIDDVISEIWKIDKKDVLEALNWKQDKSNFIKYLEDKIDKLKNKCASYGLFIDRDTAKEFDLQIKAYQDILERVKNRNYE